MIAAAALIVTPAAAAAGGHPRVSGAVLGIETTAAARLLPGRRPAAAAVLPLAFAAGTCQEHVPGAGAVLILAAAARPQVTRAVAAATAPGTRHAHRGGVR